MASKLPPQWLDTPGSLMVFFQNQWVNAITLPADVNPNMLRHAIGTFNLVAFLAICAVTAVLVIGIEESANLNTVMVGMKVAAVLVFIGVAANYLGGWPDVARQNWTTFVPPNQGSFGVFGWSGVARGAAVIFFAYIGFDAVSTAAQEAKNPQRDMPIGILGSLAICTVLYIVVAVLVTGLVKYPRLNVAAPVAVAIDSTGVSWGGTLVRLGTVLGLSTTMLVMLLGQSRVFYSMSPDGLLPAWAGAIHPTRRTPWISTIVVGFVVACFGATIPIGTLGQLVNIGTLLAFVIVSAGVWILRVRRPELPRPFRAPMVPLVPILAILISLGLMASLPWQTWMRLFIWLAIGMVVYFGYGRRHSKVI